MDKLTNEELVNDLVHYFMMFRIEGYSKEDRYLSTRNKLLSRLARVQELEKEVERLTERVDFARHNKNLMDWTEGQRAIQALEKIEKLYQGCTLHDAQKKTDKVWKILADWRKGNE